MSALAIAHRGDPFAHTENTLDAFGAAVAAGADMIELDVRRTSDGRAAVVHDPTLERIWNVRRPVSELTLADVRELGVPDLAAALDAIPQHVQVMVDYEEAGVAEPALDAVLEAGALERCVFSGDDFAGHRRIREREPGARIAATWTLETPIPDALLDELDAEFYNPSGHVLARDPTALERMRARGTKVSVWTIDEPDDMAFFLDLGVDAVITNRIADLVGLLAPGPPQADRPPERATC
ncbi:MAG TPA: glycerophosphodiester phosphodiesterase family protein [Gaiellaceae bacterium]|nr:glycerophosphodiester phosphodiesterase family protein [Gaiellaceae bacterium]